MVKQITCYEDRSGKMHRTPLEAYRADLILWLAEGEDINMASAEKLADRIIANSGEMQAMIEALRQNVPMALAA
jgi:predicted GTPase